MKNIFPFAYYCTVAIVFLLPGYTGAQYTAQSSFVKFYTAHEKFFDAVLEEDVKSLDQLLDDEICLDLLSGKFKTKADFLNALEQQQFFCDSIRYTIKAIGDFYKTGTLKGNADITFRHQLTDSSWEESVEYLTYTAKYTKHGSMVRMVSLETVHHDTGIGTCKPKSEKRKVKSEKRITNT